MQQSLNFSTGRHSGGYFALYYIQDYYEIIEAEYELGFNGTVQSIYHSFDALASAHSSSYYGDSVVDTFYNYVKTFTGLNLSSSSMSLTELNSEVSDAVSTIVQYDAEGRYVALIPSSENSYYVNSTNYGSSHSQYKTVNELLYTMFLIDPSGTWGDSESSVRSQVQSWLNSGAILTPNSLGGYAYSRSLQELGLLDVASDNKTITIKATINSAFTVDIDTISVDTGSFILATKEKSQDNSGNTVVTIKLTGDKDVDTCDVKITIPMSLVDTTSFSTSTDAYAYTNAEDTVVSVSRTMSLTTGVSLSSSEDDVSVASVALYKQAKYRLIYDANNADSLNGNPSTTQEDTNRYASGTTANIKDISEVFNEVIDTNNDGVLFVGWSKDKQYSKENPLDFDPEGTDILIKENEVTFIDSDITVYAVWAADFDNDGVADYKQYSVTFYEGTSGTLIVGNGEVDTITYNFVDTGEMLALYVPEVKADELYNFIGWRYEGESVNGLNEGMIYESDDVKNMIVECDMAFTAVYSNEEIVITDTATK